MPISAATRYCAVYGHPIKHSASPAMQNAGIAALELDWRYLAFDVHPDRLRAALDGAKAMKFIGLNLTVPHKLLALPWIDELDASAKLWGAVNTIQFEGRVQTGEWKPIAALSSVEALEVRSRGYNTDADAIVRSIQEDLHLELRGASVLVLGAGGAGRVAALKLASAGVKHLYLHNRTTAKAAAIRHEINQQSPETTVTVGYPSSPIHLVLNATSLGLNPEDPLPFDPAQFALSQAEAAYDMIYRPAETPFLKAARTCGCNAVNGLGMLLYQGAKALEIWSGQPAPIHEMKAALRQNIYGYV